MNFVEVVKEAVALELAFRRKSYKPASVWLWFDYTGGPHDVQLVIGEIEKTGKRHVQALVTLTPELILATDWQLENIDSHAPARRKTR